MLPESFHDHWDGKHWRWWALLVGCVLTAIALVLAAAIAVARDQDMAPLAFLFITLILFAFSIIGSGMFDGLASRAIAGGLARQPAEDTRGERPALNETERTRRDRRTIRSGLAALPAFVTFLALLFS